MAHKLTTGQLAVGVSFNPSGNEKVARIKELMAEVIDIIDEDNGLPEGPKKKIRDAAIHEAISAQMWAVKSVTFQEDK